MSELIERLSPYTTQLPSESSERLPSEAERKLWLVPEAVEVEETQIEEPDLATNWNSIKQGFGLMRERFKKTRTEMRAIGHLAMLDVGTASATLDNYRSNSSQLERVNSYQFPGFKDRIRSSAEDVLREKRHDRRQRINEIKTKARLSAATIGGGALVGYVSVKIAEHLS
jgi:hypothetical protein